jgi:glycerol-3-phosphate dehydrogenase
MKTLEVVLIINELAGQYLAHKRWPMSLKRTYLGLRPLQLRKK